MPKREFKAYNISKMPDYRHCERSVAIHKIYSFLERGSDERQFNFPLLNLGFVGLSRSKYDEYLQYHTSLDDLSFISKKGLEGGLEYAKNCI